MNNRLLNRHRDERGVALILTLAILVLVTILVVAFAISMRIENSAALAFSDQIRAREMALAGIDAAVMQLRTATPQITPTTSYITAPGLILTRTNGVGFSVSMYSMGANGSCDLNAGARITGITTTNITANWINYTWGQPGLVGRYAYWVDDDASKVNINTAKQRGDPLGSTPTNIDLRVFGASVQPNTSYTTATSAGYPTERSWPMGSSSAISTQDCMNGIFNITAYSANTKLTPWGAPCFNLNQSYSLPSDLVTNIAAYLQNPNLTNLFPMTFAQKYGSNCLQIAANIVAYRVPRTTVVDSLGNPPTYLGLQRTPYLNELIVSNSFRVATNVLGQLMVQMDSTTYVELWYMYPSISYPLTSHSVTLYNQPSIKFSSGQTKTFPNPNALSGITGVMVPVVGNFGVYTALVVSAEKYAFTNANLSDVTVTFNSGMVTGVFQKVLPLQRFDYAHIPMTNHTYTLKAAMAGAPDFFNPVTNLIWGSASIDPRCRPVNTYWNCLQPDHDTYVEERRKR